MKNKELSPGEFERKYNIRDIENCVSCAHSTAYDHYQYCSCTHPNRKESHRIKNCRDYICDAWKVRDE